MVSIKQNARQSLPLPPELLDEVVSHLSTAQPLARLSQACRSLNSYVYRSGYRAFAQANFGTPPSSQKYQDASESEPKDPHKQRSYWPVATQTLAELHVAWESRAFCARYIDMRAAAMQNLIKQMPADPVHGFKSTRHWAPIARGGPRRGSRGQTMGYQPQLDCSLEWSDKGMERELLAVGAGPDLRIRQGQNWIDWRPSLLRDGVDDITAVRIIRDHWWQRRPDSVDLNARVVVGRASGSLEMVTFESDEVNTIPFAIDSRSVRAAHLSPTTASSKQLLLASCLSDGDIVLHSATDPLVAQGSSEIPALSEVSTLSLADSSRSWNCHFLSQTRLALGRGPSRRPVSYYDILPTGLPKEPTRTFTISPERPESSVYCFIPLPPAANSPAGDLFLSGSLSGASFLHDARSPSHSVTLFYDVFSDPGAIYSLLTCGTQRFMAGASRHALITIFDLRMPGIRYAASEDSGYQNPCNIYLQAPTSSEQGSNGRRAAARASSNSAIYALAGADVGGQWTSPRFYVGIEGNILQVDLTSQANGKLESLRNIPPPPTLGSTIPISQASAVYSDSKEVEADKKQHQLQSAISLAAFFKGKGRQGNFEHLTQLPAGESAVDDQLEGWDRRWVRSNVHQAQEWGSEDWRSGPSRRRRRSGGRGRGVNHIPMHGSGN